MKAAGFTQSTQSGRKWVNPAISGRRGSLCSPLQNDVEITRLNALPSLQFYHFT